MAFASYTFLPWLRRGLANHLASPAGLTSARATVSVSLAVASEVERTDIPATSVPLVGPGDITGLDASQVVRTEPRAGVADFEPNYLVAIDFYDEDFPWRYAPVIPDSTRHRLQPWLALIVLKDEEHTRKQAPDRPLASFVLTSGARRADIFPPADQGWAWAHVHVNTAIAGTPAAPDRADLGARLDTNPDIGCARLLCPRRLNPNTGYTACLIPAFEVGRKAGLGEPVLDSDDGTACSWVGPADEFPIYFEWRFRTGVQGDFESLVRALVPREMDPRVGVRAMDVATPGFGIDAVDNPPDDLVALEGALLAPTTVRQGLAPGSDFVSQVAPVLNAPAEAREVATGDPVVAPPIYGGWHAQVDHVGSAPSESRWVDTVNLDPRYRAAAGLGAQIVRAHQERFMRIAWDQIGDVLRVNRQIRRAQLATKAAAALYRKSVASLPRDRFVALASPIFRKVLGSPATLAALVQGSHVPPSAVSSALTRQLRPRGPLARRLFAGSADRHAGVRLLAGINEGRLSAAPARPSPAAGVAEGIRRSLRSLSAAPARPAFRFPGAATGAALPSADPARRRPARVSGDSVAAADMRVALEAFDQALANRVPPGASRPALDLTHLHQTALAALEPHRAMAARFAPRFRVGGVDAAAFARTRYAAPPSGTVPETLQEVMAYPDIKDATYAPLEEISSEGFLPNLKLIPNNTISLLLPNRRFIEAYLAGANHELARELLWREYPTDQRGSPFRQFWDVSSYVDRDGRDAKQLAEALKDILPMHRWPVDSPLGTHPQRVAEGGRQEVVLAVRGDLLKRYPSTFIYAQRAGWGTGARQNRLVLADETGEAYATNPRDVRFRFPLYKAKVSPDIHFIGFDLTLDEVRGHPELDETAAGRVIAGDDLGWFFVLQEAVGEPRFGLDLEAPIAPSPEKWDNLSWVHLDVGEGQVIDLTRPLLAEPPGTDASGTGWGTHAADLAYVLYQDPVLVGIHGRHMLKALVSIP